MAAMPRDGSASFALTTQVRTRVRYAETDRMGLTYHAHYFAWCEMARSALFRQVGLPYTELETRGVFLPVVEAKLRYLNPLRYDDVVTVDVSVAYCKSGFIRFDYQIGRADSEEDDAEVVSAAEGYTVHAFVDEAGQPVAVPDEVTALVAGAVGK